MLSSAKSRPGLLVGLGIAAGLCYALWLLAYFLNRPVLDTLDVSALQAKGQPYYIFFVFGDIITGLIALGISYVIWRQTPNLTGQQAKILRWCAGGVAVFGLFTAISCLIPSCIATNRVCLTQANNVLDLHNVTGTVAALGLFVGVFGALMASRQHRQAFSYRLTASVLLFWSLCGIFFVIAALQVSASMLFIQHLWLLLSSVCLMLIPLALTQKGVLYIQPRGGRTQSP